jgi:hypothetical protein
MQIADMTVEELQKHIYEDVYFVEGDKYFQKEDVLWMSGSIDAAHLEVRKGRLMHFYLKKDTSTVTVECAEYRGSKDIPTHLLGFTSVEAISLWQNKIREILDKSVAELKESLEEKDADNT